MTIPLELQVDDAEVTFANPLPVGGTVALDAPTLAALESIQAAVAGTVALDAPTLAALENIIVSGTVALDSPTLAALESITAAVTGTVAVSNFPATQPVSGTLALDSATLAALESVTATVSGSVTVSGTVSVSNFPTTQAVSAASLPLPVDAASESTLAARFGAVTGSPVTVTAAGDTTVYTPAAGMRVRLKWVGLSSPSTNSAPTTATVKWSGATGNVYRWSMGAPGAFAHGSVREGAVDEALVVNLSEAQSVFVNLDVEEF